MTDLSANREPAPASLPLSGAGSPSRYDCFGWWFVLGGLVVSAVLGAFSDGIYMNDEATHYFIAREAWGDPVAMLNRWGRIGYTLPTCPVAKWLGFAGCRFFSAVQTGLIALLAWRLARRLIGPGLFAALAAALVWLQPLTFRLSLTTLTETTGALYMLLAIFLYVRGNRLWACVAFSALFLTRDETLALAPLIGVAMIIDTVRESPNRRRAVLTLLAALALLFSGPALYVLASLPVDLPPDGDPLAIFSREYSAEYGTGQYYWMAGRWCEQATATILAMGLVGLGLLVRAGRRKHPLTSDAPANSGVWLIPAWTLGYFALHSVLFARGMFAHGGEARYMVLVAGLLAVQAAVGLRAFVADRSGRVVLLYAAVLAGLLWAPFLSFAHLLGQWYVLIRNSVIAGSAGIALIGVLIVSSRRCRRPGTVAFGVLAVAMMLAQLQLYCRPLLLSYPVDPVDKSLAQAVEFIESGDLHRRSVIAKHPLVALLRPETHLCWANEEAMAVWQASPPGTVFIYDSKNCNWPDPVEQETNGLLRNLIEGQSTRLKTFTAYDHFKGCDQEAILFVKRTPAQ